MMLGTNETPENYHVDNNSVTRIVHPKYQTVEARDLTFLEKGHLPPPVMCHVSSVPCHMSHVMCHWNIYIHILCFFEQMVYASCWGSVINGAV